MPESYFLAEVLKKGLIPENQHEKFSAAWKNRKQPAGGVVLSLFLLAAFSFLSPLAWRLMAHLEDWGHLLALVGLIAATGVAIYFNLKPKKSTQDKPLSSDLWDNSLQLLAALLGQAVIAYLDLKFVNFGQGPVANLISIAWLGAWAYLTGNVSVYGMAMLSIYNLLGLKIYTFAWLDLAFQPNNYLLEWGLMLSLVGSGLAWFISLPRIPKPFLESLRVTHQFYLAACLGLMLEKTNFHPGFCLLAIAATVYWHLLAFRFSSLFLLVINCLIGYLLLLSLYFHFQELLWDDASSIPPFIPAAMMLFITGSFAWILWKQSRKLTQLNVKDDESSL